MCLAWASKIRFLITLKPIWFPRVPIALFNNVTVLILSVCKPRSFTCSPLLSVSLVKDVHSSPEWALICCASHLRTTLRGRSYIRMLSTWVWNRMTLESQWLVYKGAANWGVCTNRPLLSSWLLAPLLKIWVVRTSTPHLVVSGTDIATYVWPFFCRSCFLDWKDLVAWLLLKKIETGMLLCYFSVSSWENTWHLIVQCGHLLLSGLKNLVSCCHTGCIHWYLPTYSIILLSHWM